jgi:hypothetical protein
MLLQIVQRLALILVSPLALTLTSCDTLRFPFTGWPIDNTASEHEIGNSGGEFQDGNPPNPPRFHEGIDILDDDAPTGPWVRNTREGTVLLTPLTEGSLFNGMTVIASDGDVYKYWHLDFNSIQQAVRDAESNGTTLPANSQIAQLVTWNSCNYHHLHYEISDSIGIMDPAFTVTPRNDTTAPVILDIFFTVNATNNEFLINTVGDRILTGDVDVIAHAYDTQLGAARTGVMEMSYRVNDATNGALVKDETTIRFQDIQANTNATIVYRDSAPFDSSSNYCTTEDYYYVLTNVDGNGAIISDAAGLWDTTTLANGTYEVTVTAEDASMNSVILTEQVEISN